MHHHLCQILVLIILIYTIILNSTTIIQYTVVSSPIKSFNQNPSLQCSGDTEEASEVVLIFTLHLQLARQGINKAEIAVLKKKKSIFNI